MPTRANRIYFVEIGPFSQQEARDCASAIGSSGLVSNHRATVVGTTDAGGAHTRFTATELDQIVHIVAAAWAGGRNSTTGPPSLNTQQVRLAARCYAASQGNPEPSEDALSQVRSTDYY